MSGERDILHLIDLFILCERHIMMFKKIACEGDIFILIASIFCVKYLWRIGDAGTCYNRWIEWEMRAGVVWEAKTCCQEQTLNFLPFLCPKI